VIPIKNIYYMLSYAFQVLNEQGYKNILTEQFNNVAELCAAILTKGVSVQLKQGLRREYIEQSEALSSLRGRIEISESIKTRSMLKKQLICSYDDFSVNSYLNRIIKTTMVVLLRSDISKGRKKEIRKTLVYFEEVNVLDIETINWRIHYNRNNQTYRMLISICYLVIKGLLQTNTDGTTRLMDFLDEQRMNRLYEKFILEFYAKECPQVRATASQIPWALDDGVNSMLPVMQSDIMLSKGNEVLIIDAKYYTHTTQTQYDVHTLHSANLYQIFTYVKNKDVEFGSNPHKVSGMLLYAATDEVVQPDNIYRMSGNKISVRTLDLNQDFSDISKDLLCIVNEHFS
jgi:5-methylcytosine-specific restriction enzyme subunit McrC